MEPRVELATKDAVTRAAMLVHTGDRATMVAVLARRMAFGWLLVKIAKPSIPTADLNETNPGFNGLFRRGPAQLDRLL